MAVYATYLDLVGVPGQPTEMKVDPDSLIEENEDAGPAAVPAWTCAHCNEGFETKAKRDGHLRWCKTRKDKHVGEPAPV